MHDRRFVAEGALVLAAFLFGVTFVLVQDALDDVTPIGYLHAPVRHRRRRARSVRAAADRPAGCAEPTGGCSGAPARIAPALLLFVGYVDPERRAPVHESSTSAFITGLFAVFTPDHRGGRSGGGPRQLGVCVGIVVATVGLFLLTGAELVARPRRRAHARLRVVFGLWIVYLGAFANRFDTIPFTTVQLAVARRARGAVDAVDRSRRR